MKLLLLLLCLSACGGAEVEPQPDPNSAAYCCPGAASSVVVVTGHGPQGLVREIHCRCPKAVDKLFKAVLPCTEKSVEAWDEYNATICGG